jgi:hypothetical protein
VAAVWLVPTVAQLDGALGGHLHLTVCTTCSSSSSSSGYRRVSSK